MTVEEFTTLRHALGLTQTEMAKRMRLSLRTFQDIEARDTLRRVHALSAERVALSIAVENGDPMLAPANVRREALDLATLIRG